MIKTRLASESRRMCSKHPERPATQLRQTTERASAGEYQITRRECDDCAKRAKTGTVRRL